MGNALIAELNLEAIRGAHRRIVEMIHRTPVMTSASIDDRLGASIFFKCENLQKTGAFKARGATNAVFEMGRAQAARGVVTHSSGNHAAALARAARLRDIPAHIVMPRNAPQSKQDSVRRYGGQIVLCEPTLAARESTAAALQEQTGAHLVHPYNDLSVMAGQGTTALELMEQVPDLDAIICPVGGGGHLAGIAVAAKALSPRILVIGAEPAGADDATRSFKAGRIFPQLDPRSIADGLLSSLGDLSFAHIQRHVDDIVTVSEKQIVDSMRSIWEILKLIVEPSGAVGFAAAAQIASLRPRGRIGVVLTGGNLDLSNLPWLREKP
jgi:threonine dehydratase